MGADIIGWRNCPLQAPLGPEGFRGKLKLRSYIRVVEERVPAAQRDAVKLRVQVHGVDGAKERDLTYPQMRAELAAFAGGIPECADCPLGGGDPVGCYRYVTYPVTATFEETVMAFVVSQIATKDSICDQLYRDIFSQFSTRSAWHTRRGGAEHPLAERPTPLTYSWGGFFSKKRVDTAQILPALFMPLDRPELVVAYARFWLELTNFARERGVSCRTFEEVHAMLPLYLNAAANAVEKGWTIETDA